MQRLPSRAPPFSITLDIRPPRCVMCLVAIHYTVLRAELMTFRFRFSKLNKPTNLGSRLHELNIERNGYFITDQDSPGLEGRVPD